MDFFEKIAIALMLFLYGLLILLAVHMVKSEALVGISTDTSDPVHIGLGSEQVSCISVGTDTTCIWQNENPPTITSFSVSPTTIDLDTRATGTITFNFVITATSGQVTNAQIYNARTGLAISAGYTSTSGLGLTTSVPNITQPTETTTYRLVATNVGGASHSDATVTVTKGLLITNFRRTGFRQSQTGGPGGQYSFTFRITGTPQPNNFVFSGVHNFATDARHLTAVAGQSNTWDYTINFNIASASGSLVVVATNGTGDSATATISNIGS